MNINQKKVLGMKQIAEITVNFTKKELADFATSLGFGTPLKGETFKRQVGDLPTHAIFTIDQLQAENYETFLGCGAYESETNKANRIYYKMTIKEVDLTPKPKNGGDKPNNIRYTITKVMRNGVMYEVNPKAQYKGLAVDVNFNCAYQTKSGKNSTLFQFFRQLVSRGFISIDVPEFLQPIVVKDDKKDKKEAPKTVSNRKGKDKNEPKQA